MSWTNDDGLLVKFGVEEAVKARVTEYCTYGPKRLVEIVLDVDDLPAVADGSVLIDIGYTIPEGAYLESVSSVDTTTFTSGTSAATFNIGVIDADGGSDVTDVDGIVAAATIAELNSDVSAAAGALIGTILTEAVRLTWEVDVEAITAGEGVVRLEWSIPKVDDDTLVWAKP